MLEQVWLPSVSDGRSMRPGPSLAKEVGLRAQAEATQHGSDAPSDPSDIFTVESGEDFSETAAGSPGSLSLSLRNQVQWQSESPWSGAM